jgi:hypothetical protein
VKALKNSRLEAFQEFIAEGSKAMIPILTSDETSFAYVSARRRWPIILVRPPPTMSPDVVVSETDTAEQDRVVKDFESALSNLCEDEVQSEGWQIVESLSHLKSEIENDRPLT